MLVDTPKVGKQNKIFCILLIGPMSAEIGGTTISFQHLVRCLQARSDVRIITVDTQGIRRGGLLAAWRFAKLLFTIARQAPRSDLVRCMQVSRPSRFWVFQFLLSLGFSTGLLFSACSVASVTMACKVCRRGSANRFASDATFTWLKQRRWLMLQSGMEFTGPGGFRRVARCARER